MFEKAQRDDLLFIMNQFSGCHSHHSSTEQRYDFTPEEMTLYAVPSLHFFHIVAREFQPGIR